MIIEKYHAITYYYQLKEQNDLFITTLRKRSAVKMIMIKRTMNHPPPSCIPMHPPPLHPLSPSTLFYTWLSYYHIIFYGFQKNIFWFQLEDKKKWL